MSITIKDIAKSAGVSYSTVSKALNNSSLVNKQTKEKIMRIASQMGYYPNLAAQSLVSKKNSIVGVIWPSVQQVAWSDLITSINENLQQYGYHTFLSINPINSSIELFSSLHVDAILVFCDSDEGIQASPNVPQLYYGVTKIENHPTINLDRRTIIYKAVEHLAGLGHRKLAFIGGMMRSNGNQKDKYIGFMEGLVHFGLPYDPNMIIELDSFSWQKGYEGMNQVLNSGYLPTAVISASYEITIGILKALHQAGLRVPEDVSIVSYDNIPQMESLEITAAGVPVDKISEQLTSSLLLLLEDPASVPSTIIKDAEIKVRKSTAPPPE